MQALPVEQYGWVRVQILAGELNTAAYFEAGADFVNLGTLMPYFIVKERFWALNCLFLRVGLMFGH